MSDNLLKSILAEASLIAQQLDIGLDHPMRSAFSGAHPGAASGREGDFVGHFRYEQGDDVRDLDWQVTARTQAPFVRRYRGISALRVFLAMDVSRSMGSVEGTSSVRTTSTTIIGAIALCATKNGHYVGGITFGSSVASRIPLRGGEGHALSLIHHYINNTSDQTDLRAALRELIGMRGNYLVVLISDFLCHPPLFHPSIQQLLRACAKKHEVRAVLIRELLPCTLQGDTFIETEERECGKAIVMDSNYGSTNPSPAEILRKCGIRTIEIHSREAWVSKLTSLLANRHYTLKAAAVPKI